VELTEHKNGFMLPKFLKSKRKLQVAIQPSRTVIQLLDVNTVCREGTFPKNKVTGFNIGDAKDFDEVCFIHLNRDGNSIITVLEKNEDDDAEQLFYTF
jgi:hypothetical protein